MTSPSFLNFAIRSASGTGVPIAGASHVLKQKRFGTWSRLGLFLSAHLVVEEVIFEIKINEIMWRIVKNTPETIADLQF